MLITGRCKTSFRYILPWLVFGILWPGSAVMAETLLQVYEQALKHDPAWAAAREAYFADAQAKNIALAGLLPQIYGGASVSSSQYHAEASSGVDTSLAGLSNVSLIDALSCYNQYGLDDRSALINCLNQQRSASNSNSSSSFVTTTYSLNIAQPLFRADRWYQYQQGRLIRDKAQIDFVRAQQDLMLNIAEAYFTALRAQDEASFAQIQTLKLAAQLQGTEKLFSLGRVQDTQVYQAQAALDLSQTTKIVADSGYQAALEVLENLTRNPAIDVMTLPRNIPIEPPQPTNPAAWVATAKTHNLDLQASRIAARAARSDYLAKQAAHAPTVDFFTSYSQTRSDGLTNVINEGRTTSTAFGVSVNVPIYSGGLTSSLARQAKHRQLQTENLSDAMERRVTSDARRFYRKVITHIKHIEAQQVAVLSEDKALDAVKNEYQRGQRTVADVLEVQQHLFSAQKDLSDARYDYILDTLRLKRASGVLALEDLKILNAWFESPNTSALPIENATLPKRLRPQPLDPHAIPSSSEARRPHNLLDAIKQWANP